MMSALHRCTGSSSTTAQKKYFEDGTVRTTLATFSNLGAGSAPFEAGASDECKEFERLAMRFRNVVDDASLLFVSRLSSAIDSGVNGPILSDVSGGKAFNTLLDIVLGGNHLDHFHSYAATAARHDIKTLDYHLDQGLFIALAPAMMVRREDGVPTGHSPGEFLAKIRGEEASLLLDESSLLFMLGDGVNQVINPMLKAGITPLPAVMHALVMPAARLPAESRTWFGRMFFAPDDALRPATGRSFGEERAQVIAYTSAEAPADLPSNVGCSPHLQAVRRLDRLDPKALEPYPGALLNMGSATPDSCNSTNAIFCWSACMVFAPAANPAHCAAQSSGFNCTSDLNDGVYHATDGMGQFRPRCTNSTTAYADPPTVPAPAPAPAQPSCPAYAIPADVLARYDYKYTLTAQAELYWAVKGDTVAFAIGRSGARVGYIGFGIGGPIYPKMFHSGVVLASADAAGQTTFINEYAIGDKGTAFAYWNTVYEGNGGGSIAHKALTLTPCGTLFQFEGSSFAGKAVNRTGPNAFIYAADTTHYGVYTTFEGFPWLFYHSERLAFTVDSLTDAKYLIQTPTRKEADVSGMSAAAGADLSAASALVALGLGLTVAGLRT
jgi:hypothetical protein